MRDWRCKFELKGLIAIAQVRDRWKALIDGEVCKKQPQIILVIQNNLQLKTKVNFSVRFKQNKI